MAVDLNRLSLDALASTLLPTALLRRETKRFLEEDERGGDITSRLAIPATAHGHARVVAREACVLAGIDAAAFVATVGKRRVAVRERRRDGARLRKGEVVAVLEGRLRDLLTIERTMLNLLGRMSGIATRTSEFVAAVRSAVGSRTVVVDTRKTTPGLRAFEKYAVRCGGGTLHRIGLFDAILVKDNHLASLMAEPGGALQALRRRLQRGRGDVAFVEVEVDRLDQFDEILRWPRGLVDLVLLDNMTPAQMRDAVRRRDRARSSIKLEASGGVKLENIASIARTGVERISVGALTHSVRSIDFSMEFDPPPKARLGPRAPARARAGRGARANARERGR